jgi:hypothetical protein
MALFCLRLPSTNSGFPHLNRGVEMASRVFACVLLAWFTIIALLALKAICSTHTLVVVFESFSSARHRAFDTADWSSRWIFFNSFLFGVSLLGLAGCLLTAYQHASGLMLMAASFLLWANITWVIKLLHARVYRWEGFSFTCNALFFAIAVACLVLFVLGRHRTRLVKQVAV